MTDGPAHVELKGSLLVLPGDALDGSVRAHRGHSINSTASRKEATPPQSSVSPSKVKSHGFSQAAEIDRLNIQMQDTAPLLAEIGRLKLQNCQLEDAICSWKASTERADKETALAKDMGSRVISKTNLRRDGSPQRNLEALSIQQASSNSLEAPSATSVPSNSALQADVRAATADESVVSGDRLGCSADASSFEADMCATSRSAAEAPTRGLQHLSPDGRVNVVRSSSVGVLRRPVTPTAQVRQSIIWLGTQNGGTAPFDAGSRHQVRGAVPNAMPFQQGQPNRNVQPYFASHLQVLPAKHLQADFRFQPARASSRHTIR